ncbi:MAG: T9SS type A sorting domain-containing protein [Bacteroidetes bacterium]|nr:T9SS type A sorting domain-containing protein [Bacteroidota bacterium]
MNFRCGWKNTKPRCTSNADTRIDVSQLPDGLYLVRVIRGNKIETMKFLKY